VDRLSKERRSWNMGRIRSANTTPEIRVRSILHRLGYRFRLHSKELPGRPDIVLPKWHHVIFVHGCFWHRHEDCKFCYTPKSRTDFWTAKFEGTIRRDRAAETALRSMGWHVSIVWECEIGDEVKLASKLRAAIQRAA
jgi:DNA mismatch endonuclease (patch repair protein)